MSAIHALPPTSDHIYVLPGSQEQLNLQTLIGTTVYQANITKRLIIPSGVVVGSASTATAALRVPAGAKGRLIIENYGSIYGAGGAAGANGGDAIFAESTCTVINQAGGLIYSGGGGGGTGGTGGVGGGGTFSQVCCFYTGAAVLSRTCSGSCSAGTFCYSADCVAAAGSRYRCSTCASTQVYYTSGGAGGAGGGGGVGRGYNQSLTTGSTGSAGSAGGTNAGTGGTGGTGGSGGDWGTSGETGSTGSAGANGNWTAGSAGAAGASGGLAGFYINGLSTLVTFTNNGSIAGRSN